MDLKRALHDASTQLKSKFAVQMVAVFLLFRLGSVIITNSLTVAVQEALQAAAERNGELTTDTFGAQSPDLAFVVDLPGTLLLFLLVGTVFIAEMLHIITIRGAAWDIDSLTDRSLFDNIMLTTLNGVLAGTIALIAIFIGLGLFVLPGLYLVGALYFVRQEVALEDKQFIEALNDTWELTEGNRVLLAVFATGLFLLSGLLPATVSLVGLPTVPAITLQAIVGSVVNVFSVFAVTALYSQISEV